MNKPLQLLAGVIAVAALALACVELAKLMDTGTCASGGPYVSANPCPEGTGTQILLLMGAILVFVIAMLASGQGLFFFGLLFVALSATFIRGAITDDDFAAAGYTVGAIFAVMGVVPMFMAIRGWFEDDNSAARSRASGLAVVHAGGDGAGSGDGDGDGARAAAPSRQPGQAPAARRPARARRPQRRRVRIREGEDPQWLLTAHSSFRHISRDDVAHVVLVLDPAGGWPLLVREDAVVEHAAGRDELGRTVAMGTSA